MSEQSLPDGVRPQNADALPEYAERVLDMTELIPPGRVMTYGDVAEYLEEGGPRQVGRVMSLYGEASPGGVSSARTGSCSRGTSWRRSTATGRRARP